MVTGRLDEGEEGLAKAVQVSEAANDVPTLVMAKSTSGQLLNWRGDYREATRNGGSAQPGTPTDTGIVHYAFTLVFQRSTRYISS